MGEGGIQPMGRAGAAGVAQCRSGCRYYRKKERHMYSRPHIPVPYGSLRAKIIRKAAQFGSSGRPHSLQGSGLTAGQVYCLGNALGSLVTSLSQWSEPQRVYHDAEPGRSELKFVCFLKMSYMVKPNKENNHVITKRYCDKISCHVRAYHHPSVRHILSFVSAYSILTPCLSIPLQS